MDKKDNVLDTVESTLENFYRQVDFDKSIIKEKQPEPVKESVKEPLNEGSSGTPIKARGTIPSADRNKLLYVYEKLRDVLYEPNYNIDFQQDRIVITLKDHARISYDYTPYMGSLIEHMLEEGMEIEPLPNIKVKHDDVQAADFFGKTAQYDPETKEIQLFVKGRHPKDVMRSFSHEMIHHKQNLEGKINNIHTQNTNEDSNLSELEQEAYLLGNMLFRNWEDKVKQKHYNNE